MKNVLSLIAALGVIGLSSGIAFACGDDADCDGSQCKGKSSAKHAGKSGKQSQCKPAKSAKAAATEAAASDASKENPSAAK